MGGGLEAEDREKVFGDDGELLHERLVLELVLEFRRQMTEGTVVDDVYVLFLVVKVPEFKLPVRGVQVLSSIAEQVFLRIASSVVDIGELDRDTLYDKGPV